ncbi:MAG: glutamate--tRNA ligase [Caulobacterales bacterium]
MSVVTRFAPSPTGLLHIGGARTALFNWLFARRHGGSYLLRIEDTDRARSTDAAVAAIHDGLTWLGLEGDAPTVYQFERASTHRDVAESMVARGAAFRCYVTPDELEARRTEASAAREKLAGLKKEGANTEAVASAQANVEKFNQAFRSPYRDGMKPPGDNAPFVIRLRAPDDGDILNADLVQGDVRVNAREIDDLILLRADGTPTYMLSVVVDDHDMGVTHVIRGDDHLSNAARQIPIFQAMGWTAPRYAHIPLIHGSDGAKLSKRHGAQAVHEYRDAGYLPEALLNYLARLGWSYGDRELFTLQEAAKVFDLANVSKGPARLDFEKLRSVNAHYMRDADDGRLAQLVFEHIQQDESKRWSISDAGRARVHVAITLLKTRAKTIPELADQAHFLLQIRPLQLDAAAQKAMKDETKALLRQLRARLASLDAWDAETIGAAIKAFATEAGVGMGQFGPGLRAALTGGAPAPDLAQALAYLGREEALGRIDDQV